MHFKWPKFWCSFALCAPRFVSWESHPHCEAHFCLVGLVFFRAVLSVFLMVPPANRRQTVLKSLFNEKTQAVCEPDQKGTITCSIVWMVSLLAHCFPWLTLLVGQNALLRLLCLPSTSSSTCAFLNWGPPIYSQQFFLNLARGAGAIAHDKKNCFFTLNLGACPDSAHFFMASSWRRCARWAKDPSATV